MVTGYRAHKPTTVCYYWHMYCNLRKTHVENVCVKNFRVRVFSWVWQTSKIKRENFWISKILSIKHTKIYDVCLWSVMYTYRESEMNHPSSCWWTTVTVIAGHGGFCKRYNSMLLAFTCMGIASRAWASHTMASWPTAVPWDLEACFSIQNTSWSKLPAISALKPCVMWP